MYEKTFKMFAFFSTKYKDKKTGRILNQQWIEKKIKIKECIVYSEILSIYLRF